MMMPAGCMTVGPDYVPGPLTAPTAWHTQTEKGLTEGATDYQIQSDWWSVFNDPMLSDLMNRAIAGNLDLITAKSRLQEARAQRGISKAAAYPNLDAAASARKTTSSSESGSGTDREFYTAGFDASWELDIFGGTKRSVEAAQATLESVTGDLGNVRVSLLAEVARNYIEMRTFQAKLAATEANIKTQKETHQLAAWRLSAGLGNELELEQARYNLASTLSAKPAVITSLESAKNRLAVLLGVPPGRLHKELEAPGAIPVPSEQITIGIPADVLRQRPDIYAAERDLAAQTAMIGVATAKLYPQFSLNGSVGWEALSAKSLFSLSAKTSSIGPQVTWSVFDGGAVRRNIEVQTTLRDQALSQYESAILTALEEVENALQAYSGEKSRMEFLTEAVRAAKEAEKLVRIRYTSGLADFGLVLEAQRFLYSFQTQLADSRGQIASDLIALYKALGGGWQPIDIDQSPYNQASITQQKKGITDENN